MEIRTSYWGMMAVFLGSNCRKSQYMMFYKGSIENTRILLSDGKRFLYEAVL